MEGMGEGGVEGVGMGGREVAEGHLPVLGAKHETGGKGTGTGQEEAAVRGTRISGDAMHKRRTTGGGGGGAAAISGVAAGSIGRSFRSCSTSSTSTSSRKVSLKEDFPGAFFLGKGLSVLPRRRRETKHGGAGQEREQLVQE